LISEQHRGRALRHFPATDALQALVERIGAGVLLRELAEPGDQGIGEFHGRHSSGHLCRALDKFSFPGKRGRKTAALR
jgi:hypothetical protein